MGNNKIWISLLALVFLLAGCGGEAAGGTPQKSAPEAGSMSFVAGMGCTDPNCTDPGHHHDCPVDCADYEHHHNCALDCAEPSHNHAGHHDEPGHTEAPAAVPVSFVAGMGCEDPNCTDPDHHHDCPADCADYEHHHHCPLDCTDSSHNHKDHHEEPHHTAAVEPAPSVEPQPEPAPEPEPVSAPAPQPEPPVVQTQTLTAVSYISGMGCSDPNCTDPSHYHDCPADCANYEHYHHCALNCAETGHHHANHHSETSTAVPVSFVAGMGCSDPNCTDPSHYHDCPADCANYEHHHACALDCAEPSHCHAGTAVSTGGGRHHGGGHHGRHH
mgnify:CR=1 FL=1